MLNKTYTNVRNFSLILLSTIFVLVILKNLNIVNANSEIIISENETVITSNSSSNNHNWSTKNQVNDSDFANIHYIDNANYFIVNPLHNENVGNDNENGVCTTVAMQLLMGYHNYYSDRRLIPVFNEDGDDLKTIINKTFKEELYKKKLLFGGVLDELQKIKNDGTMQS